MVTVFKHESGSFFFFEKHNRNSGASLFPPSEGTFCCRSLTCCFCFLRTSTDDRNDTSNVDAEERRNVAGGCHLNESAEANDKQRTVTWVLSHNSDGMTMVKKTTAIN